MPDRNPKEHRTVSRVTAILEALASNPDGVRLPYVATVLDAPKSSTHVLLRGLVAQGYAVERDGTYSLGPAIEALVLRGGPRLVDAAKHELRALRDRFDETVTVATRVGQSVVYTYIVESTQVVRYVPPLRERRPMYPTSAGKCFLAHKGSRFQREYLLGQLRDPDDAEAIRAELERIRMQGYALNRGETIPDVFAVAGPVIVDDTVVGCITMAGPQSRMEGRMSAVGEAVRDAAAVVGGRLSKRGGGTQSPGKKGVGD